MVINNKSFIVGVDAGGTKTTAALANMSGKILKTANGDGANPRNIGILAAAKNITAAISKIIPKKKNIKIAATIIGLPAIEEEFKNRQKEIIAVLKQNKNIAAIFGGKVQIVSDQLTAFCAGTDTADGVVAIAGTGCVARGWNGNKEVKANGWGWLADEGSGFWIGQKFFQLVFKAYDNRFNDPAIINLAKQYFKVKTETNFARLVYKNPFQVIPLLAHLCHQADTAGNINAHQIMQEAGKEIAASIISVIQQLQFNTPPVIVFSGGVFNSVTVFESTRNELEKFFRQPINIIKSDLPVIGAIKLAKKLADMP